MAEQGLPPTLERQLRALLRGDRGGVLNTARTWLPWTPTLTGYSANPSGIYRYWKDGPLVHLSIFQTANGTSNATTKTISLPPGLTAVTIANMQWLGSARGVDNGVTLAPPAMLRISSAATVLDEFKDYAATAWTAAGGHRLLGGFITYECVT